MKRSWGQYPKVFNQRSIAPIWRDDAIAFSDTNNYLPFGRGRSYGDSCLNENGILIDTQWLNHIISFNSKSGVIRCEAGVTLDNILQLVVKRNWFLPVLPGTKFVSVGGAIANDIHGKNHHIAGTFGSHVKQFELLRSDGKRYLCSTTKNQELYHATIGGLGLTGLIVWADIQLRPINNAYMQGESIKFNNLKEFFAVNTQSLHDYEYTVAWIDTQATGQQFGRGLYMRANHAKANYEIEKSESKGKTISIPLNFPSYFLNPISIKLFNHLYYNKQHHKIMPQSQYYEPFFFPLDSILAWNKIYGSKGFLQYQCVIEDDAQHSATQSILELITESKQGSFLSVLKTFGHKSSPGMLSFPKPGVTLALDFPNKGSKTFSLLAKLDEIVLANKGRIYPAKDARMSEKTFKQYYPNWYEFSEYIDPKFSSNLWRRVINEE